MTDNRPIDWNKCPNCAKLRAINDLLREQIRLAESSADVWRNEAMKNMQLGLTSHRLNDMLHQMNGKKGTV